MKVAVIAANGRTGKEFVKIALEHGHTVRAGVYGHHDFPEDPNLTIIECDATNSAQLAYLMQHAEAVVSFIGHVRKSPAHVQTEAIHNAVEVAKNSGIRRVISLTGTGVRFPGDNITLADRFFNISIRIIDPKRVKDGKKHVDVLKDSGLDWTVIRVLKLKNGSPEPFSLLPNGPTKTFTSRSEVALAALEILETNTFISQAPIIGKKTAA